MIILDFLDPRSVLTGSVAPGLFVLLHYALGWVAVLFVRWVGPTRGVRSAPFAAALAPLLGLVLVNVEYPCFGCTPKPDWCEVSMLGIPFPQSILQQDPESPKLYDVCGMRYMHRLSEVAAVGDYAVGVVAVPLLIARGPVFWRRKRDSPAKPAKAKVIT